VCESLILHVHAEEEELGRLFLVHGHQGTLDSDRIAPLSNEEANVHRIHGVGVVLRTIRGGSCGCSRLQFK
jgi:hypothetical protein